jgi:hypothetical protein
MPSDEKVREATVGLKEWLRDTAHEAFRFHHAIGGSEYGPGQPRLTDAIRDACVAVGTAGTLLQGALNGLKLTPRRHDGSWWAYDPEHDSDTGPYATRQEAQGWINDIRQRTQQPDAE